MCIFVGQYMYTLSFERTVMSLIEIAGWINLDLIHQTKFGTLSKKKKKYLKKKYLKKKNFLKQKKCLKQKKMKKA